MHSSMQAACGIPSQTGGGLHIMHPGMNWTLLCAAVPAAGQAAGLGQQAHLGHKQLGGPAHGLGR